MASVRILLTAHPCFISMSLRPQRLDKVALHALFKNTNEGAGWACKKGWGSVLEGDSSALFGVTTEGGRVTKISLGANGLEGAVTVVSFAKTVFGCMGRCRYNSSVSSESDRPSGGHMFCRVPVFCFSP